MLPPATDNQSNDQPIESGALHARLDTCCSRPLTSLEAPVPKPADSQWRSPLRDSPQRTATTALWSSTQMACFLTNDVALAQRRKEREETCSSQTCTSPKYLPVKTSQVNSDTHHFLKITQTHKNQSTTPTPKRESSQEQPARPREPNLVTALPFRGGVGPAQRPTNRVGPSRFRL